MQYTDREGDGAMCGANLGTAAAVVGNAASPFDDDEPTTRTLETNGTMPNPSATESRKFPFFLTRADAQIVGRIKLTAACTFDAVPRQHYRSNVYGMRSSD